MSVSGGSDRPNEEEKNARYIRRLHPAWYIFIRYCESLKSGEVEKLKIQDGLPIIAEEVVRKVTFPSKKTTEENRESETFSQELKDLLAENLQTDKPMDLKKLIFGLEREIIRRTLSELEGNQREAAKALGIKYTTLNEKIKKYKIFSDDDS